MSDPTPVLYTFRRCPYAMRARMGLAAAAIKVEIREILLRDKPAEMLAASAKGTVPVLCLPDGQVIDESLEVLQWALQQNDPHAWLSNADLAQSLCLIERNDQDFKHWLDRYKYHVRHPEKTQLEYRQKGEEFLRELESQLAEHPSGVLADQACLADVAIFPFIRQFSGVEPAWWQQKPYPALHAWLNNWLQSARFQSIMQKFPLWQAGEDPLLSQWR